MYKYWKEYQFRYWYIESMSGRSPKNGKGSGRPKKTKSNDEILDEFLNDLNKEDLIKIIKIISTDDRN
nr:hypothetical protein [Mycoplasmopsis bovis]